MIVIKDILFISDNLSIKDLNLLYNITNCYVSPIDLSMDLICLLK